ncbi:type I-E CRISPR-associated protein Cse2/CasB [Pikeienuella sp. HZG-20]|uniref:type I-E CRISPR-associated protein Cse2/CasB n=1 Tax=Paludibacillus litoralis TaxID=3133267 RepID=UPI0030EBB530
MTSPDAKRPGQICLSWWCRRIRPSEDTSDAKRNRAALRRVATPVEVVAVEAVHDLNARLAETGHDLRPRADRLMLIAVALAQLRNHQPGRRAALVFGEQVNDRRRLGAIRFEALIRQTEPLQLTRPLVRALGIIDGRADVASLADDLFYWSDPVRTRWCFDYYGAPSAAPDQSLISSEASA